MMHFPEFVNIVKGMLKGNTTMPTCWVQERKHKVPKRFLNNSTSISVAFDTSHLREVTCYHVAQLVDLTAEDFFECGLIRPMEAPQALAVRLRTLFPGGAVISRAARCNAFEVVWVDDVVIGETGGVTFLGKVTLHCRPTAGECLTFLETWTCLESLATHSRWDRKTPGGRCVRTDDILAACVYADCGDNIVRVLRGPRARPRAATT